MDKASILSGERVFLQSRGQRRAGFIAGSCKTCKAKKRIRETSINYSTLGSVTARNLYRTTKAKVLE